MLRRLAFDAGRAMAVADAGAAAPLVSLALDGTAGARAAPRARSASSQSSPGARGERDARGHHRADRPLVADANATADARLAAAAALGMIGSYAVGAAGISATNAHADGVVSTVAALEGLRRRPEQPDATAALVALERLADKRDGGRVRLDRRRAAGGWDATASTRRRATPTTAGLCRGGSTGRTASGRAPPGVSWNGTVLKSGSRVCGVV